MALFDQTIFNGEVFGKYIDTIPYSLMTELLLSGAVVEDNSVRDKFDEQQGGFMFTTPIKGVIYDAEADNYDGLTNLTTDSGKTYRHSRIVIGRGHGFTEKDFAADISGGYDPLETAANQIGGWRDTIHAKDILATLEGVYSMTDTAGVNFTNKHTYNITAMANAQGVTGKPDATTFNTAMQKACGDNKGSFALAIMHSAVVTSLENLNIVEYLKYTDSNGMTRDTNFATVNGRLVYMTDKVPFEEDESTATYAKTTDTALVTGKVYYTRSGSSGNYVYTAVDTPDVANIGNYYEKTQAGNLIYTTYLFGLGAILHTDCGAKNPYTVSRDESKNGGEETLWVRMRDIFAPRYISFKDTNLASLSPTVAELKDGRNWELTATGGVNKEYVDDKFISIARVLSY